VVVLLEEEEGADAAGMGEVR
jgi:hypothetical protein